MQNRHKYSLSINTDSKKLSNRISAHKNYSTYDINEWILQHISPKKGEKILDIGCGTGEQLLRCAKACGPGSTVIGIDASSDSLTIIKENCGKAGLTNVKTILGNIDDLLSILHSQNDFDIVISCFALYYSKNIPQLISDIKRVLNKDGRFFVCGPEIGNNSELIEFQSQISRSFQAVKYPMSDLILPEIIRNFKNVSKFHFHNPLQFPNADSLIAYWKSYILFDATIKKDFISHTKKYFENHSKFITTKRVIGILAHM